jgi:hypothetical protein
VTSRWQPSDRDPVIEACTRMYWHIDRREWDALAEVLDSEVHVAFPDLGSAGATRSRDAVIESYRKTVANFDSTQHLLGSFLVVPGEAHGTAACSAQVVAVHHRANSTGDPLWVLGCQHHYTVRRTESGSWRIAELRMAVSWASGNQHITALGARTTEI